MPTITPPRSIALTVPADLASSLAVYVDTRGIMQLVGPRGWKCAAGYGVDGGGGITVYPLGDPTPSTAPFVGSPAEAIVGSETSACVGCTEAQACPLFTSAAIAYQANYGPCPHTRPPKEESQFVSLTAVRFTDPPGVAGDGAPSGGPYQADGAMTYNPQSENGSYIDTCTLPANDQPICDVALDAFVANYGSD